MTREEKQRIVTETLTGFELHFRDPARVLQHCTDDLDWWIAGSAKTSGRMDRAAMTAMLEGLPSFTDTGMRLIPHSFVIEGDRVAVEGESYMEIKDGRVYRNLYHWLFELRGDKVAKVREYLDTALVEELVGKA